MIRPEDLSPDRRAEAWLAYIEREILLSSPYRVNHADLLVVTIDRLLPLDLTDIVDDYLKADGWRLRRQPHDYTGEPTAPQRSYVNRLGVEVVSFDIVEDKPCVWHTYRRRDSASDPEPFCTFCGAKESQS